MKTQGKTNKISNPFLELSSHLKTTPFSTQELVLDKANITEIGENDLSYYPNLQALYIPGNKIQVLNHLDKNIRLTIIDARDNQIVDFDFKKQTFLTDLFLSGNKLQDLECILGKLCHLRNLETLDLRGNPLTLEKGYRQQVLNAMPWLINLDGIETKQDKQRAQLKQIMITRGNRSLHPTRSGRRPQSILEQLRTRPLSAADLVVKRKAAHIRAQTQLRLKREEEERTAAARKQREEFEMKAQQEELPMPEGLDFLGQLKKKEQVVEEKTVSNRRPISRMYLKKPVYTQPSKLSKDDEVMRRFNPELPLFNLRVHNEETFAK